jgi:hypothetical protein
MALDKFGSDELLDELQRRVARLERASKRIGSVGAARLLVAEAFDAGRGAGRVEAQSALAHRLQDILDEATEKFDTTAANSDAWEPALNAWREGRRHLWTLLDREGRAIVQTATVENDTAAKRRQWLEQRVREVLAPGVPLRQRVGQWLLTSSARLAQRGAS